MTEKYHRCPKCRSTIISLFEYTSAFMEFDMETGDQVNSGFGDVTGLKMRCNDCEHWWTPRGKNQSIDFEVIRRNP